LDYERFHVADVNIEDEQHSNNGLDVTVHVDTLEMVNIELGESMTIRTDEAGIMGLLHLLQDAEHALMEVRCRKVNEAMDKMTEDMNPIGSHSSDGMSETQSVDVYDMSLANDPVRW